MLLRKLFIGILAGATALSLGQFGNVPEAEYMPAIFLNPAVAKDMHLSQDVVTKEQSVMMQQGMAMMPLVSKQNSASTPAEKRQLAQAMYKAYQKMEAASLVPLTPAQRARYKQLSLQFFGPMALAQPRQQAALNLTPAQKSKLMSFLASSGRNVANKMKGMQGGTTNRANAMGAMNTLAKTREQQEAGLKTILTPAQLAKWNAMQGRKLPGLTNIFGGMGMGAG